MWLRVSRGAAEFVVPQMRSGAFLEMRCLVPNHCSCLDFGESWSSPQQQQQWALGTSLDYASGGGWENILLLCDEHTTSYLDRASNLGIESSSLGCRTNFLRRDLVTFLNVL